MLVKSLYAAGKRCDTRRRDVVAKEVQLLDGENTLLAVDNEAGGTEALEEVVQVRQMLLRGGTRTGDQHVVQVAEGRRQAIQRAVQ
jgi:hypothetical protein